MIVELFSVSKPDDVCVAAIDLKTSVSQPGSAFIVLWAGRYFTCKVR